jgi:hypothetical protein
MSMRGLTHFQYVVQVPPQCTSSGRIGASDTEQHNFSITIANIEHAQVLGSQQIEKFDLIIPQSITVVQQAPE